MGYEDVINMLKIGAITDNSCEFNLGRLINKDRMPEVTNAFFDLYI